MSTIHFLNVNEGDCSIIQHPSGRVTVIDVCNASIPDLANKMLHLIRVLQAKQDHGSGGNFRQKENPVNPIAYLGDQGIDQIFRFVLTHPDMDHMDGIRALFSEFEPLNFWDTDNNKEIDVASWTGSLYDPEDWCFYKSLRDHPQGHDHKRLALQSGASGKLYNNGSPDGMGDQISILAPTAELVDEANRTGNYNDCSYVLLLETGNHRIIFGGDSHDKTWDSILETYEGYIKDIDLLIAPHHGRRSDRSYQFLDVLRPKLTLFGNAPSQYLAYGAWNYRELDYITNNQAGCIIADDIVGPLVIYVTHENFARQRNPETWYNEKLDAWWLTIL